MVCSTQHVSANHTFGRRYRRGSKECYPVIFDWPKGLPSFQANEVLDVMKMQLNDRQGVTNVADRLVAGIIYSALAHTPSHSTLGLGYCGMKLVLQEEQGEQIVNWLQIVNW